MIWSDNGYLLSKNKYGENSVIAEFFTENHGKISGIIYGATSKKIRNYLQIGNKFHINYNSKTENKIGYFNIEIIKILTPLFFEDKKKLSCIVSSMSLIKLLTVENQSNINIFNQLYELFKILNSNEWIKNFIFWELEVIKLVGYDIKFSDYIDNAKLRDNLSYIPTYDGSKKIPSFLLKNDNSKINNDELKDGLKIVGDFLKKSVLIPNNINYPLLRTKFVKLL